MQLSFRLLFFVFLLQEPAEAQQHKNSSAFSLRPVSISYKEVRKCFPEIQDEKLSFKVDLTRLKELVDARFLSTKSQIRMRKVHFQDADRQVRFLVLRNISSPKGKIETQMSLQVMDEKGSLADVSLTRSQSLNPKPEVINSFLQGSKIISDQVWHHDTKLKGVTASYRQNFKEIEEYELRDVLAKRSLSCSAQLDLGIICACSKK